MDFKKAKELLNSQPVSKINRRVYCPNCEESHQITDDNGNSVALPIYCELKVKIE